jgi:hypothetical protein
MAEVVAQPVAVRGSYGVGYIEWGPIFAGAVLAAALSFVLLTFGTGIGISLLSPDPSHSYGRAAASIAALWGLSVPIGSLLVGGYIAGRMRAPREGADEAETEFRDGLHGALVWGVAVLFGAVLTFFAASAAAHTGLAVDPAGAAEKGAVYAPAVDTLFSPVTVADATPAPAPPTSAAKLGVGAPTSPSAVRSADEAAERVIASGVAAGHLGASERSYLANLVSQRTGMSAAEAEKRVDQAFAEARHAADRARRAAVVTSLVTATALLIGLAGAWYGAQRGGHHRDRNIPARFTWGWRNWDWKSRRTDVNRAPL